MRKKKKTFFFLVFNLCLLYQSDTLLLGFPCCVCKAKMTHGFLTWGAIADFVWFTVHSAVWAIHKKKVGKYREETSVTKLYTEETREWKIISETAWRKPSPLQSSTCEIIQLIWFYTSEIFLWNYLSLLYNANPDKWTKCICWITVTTAHIPGNNTQIHSCSLTKTPVSNSKEVFSLMVFRSSYATADPSFRILKDSEPTQIEYASLSM